MMSLDTALIQDLCAIDDSLPRKHTPARSGCLWNCCQFLSILGRNRRTIPHHNLKLSRLTTRTVDFRMIGCSPEEESCVTGIDTSQIESLSELCSSWVLGYIKSTRARIYVLGSRYPLYTIRQLLGDPPL